MADSDKAPGRAGRKVAVAATKSATKTTTKATTKTSAKATTKTSAQPGRKQAAPAKKAPAKKAPTAKKAPAKTAATKTSPTKTSPTKTSPTKTSPTKTTAAKAAGKKRAPAPTQPPAERAAKAPAKPAAKTPARQVSKAAAKAAAKAPSRSVAETASALRVREDESPWTPAELAQVRAALEGHDQRLGGEISQAESGLADLLRDSGDGAGDDQADAGAKTFEREQEISLANNSREMLLQSERALARIADGTYGVCESCGNPIGKLRLQVFPRATLCMTCKQRQERR
jgi:RNA polymerase-binding transcription factor DksA